MQLRLFLGVLLACSLLFPAGKRLVTIDDLIAYHPPESISPVWSPDKNSFAYEESGIVYVYSIANRKAKKWFEKSKLEDSATAPVEPRQYSWRDRYVTEADFQWFPNGRDLLVSAKGDIFIVHPNGNFEQITATERLEEDLKLSPDGRSVLFRSNHDLYVIDLATRQTRQLTTGGTPTLLNGELDWVYPEELELHTATWWSPDSKQIAYLQFNIADELVYPQTNLLGERALAEPEHYPQAGTPNASVRLGVVSADGGPTRWMEVGNDPGVLLARVAWLPDSSTVALETMPRVQNRLDLLFCNPGDGTTRRVIHEESKTWINLGDNLHFVRSGNEFLWTSERSGFRHIYRYSWNGELLGQVTSGDWQVDSIAAIDERQQRIYYLSRETSPVETQLYAVGFDGGERTRITQPGFNHEIEATPDGSYFLDTSSNLKTPPASSIRNASGEQIAVFRKFDAGPIRDLSLQFPEIVEVKSPEGPLFYARLIKPAGFQAGKKYPAIVHVYGGPGVQTVRNTWAGVDWDQVLAARGYVVWQLDNRGSTGRGHAFETPVYHSLGKQEVQDQRLGVNYLIKLGFVDPERIGITGWSYGGYMTIHSLLLAPDLFKVGVAGAPVTDWKNYDTIYTERYMDVPEKNGEGYASSSNVGNAQKLQGKLLIVHNFEDDNVLFQNTMQMANALENAGKQYFLQIYPQRTHHVSGQPEKALYEAMTDFFDRNLK